MFSGIVEALGPILGVKSLQDSLQIEVAKPADYNDIHIGDSIACNGVCLTAEVITDHHIQFTLGAETLKVTGWNAESLEARPLNMERSLRMGDRVHGHWVSGHVDCVAKVKSVDKSDSWILAFELNPIDRRYVWTKGSITFNGVSLTVNSISGNTIEVCLIPETLLRTNLKDLNPGDSVNVEYDYWAKAFVNYQEQREAAQ